MSWIKGWRGPAVAAGALVVALPTFLAVRALLNNGAASNIPREPRPLPYSTSRAVEVTPDTVETVKAKIRDRVERDAVVAALPEAQRAALLEQALPIATARFALTFDEYFDLVKALGGRVDEEYYTAMGVQEVDGQSVRTADQVMKMQRKAWKLERWVSVDLSQVSVHVLPHNQDGTVGPVARESTGLQSGRMVRLPIKFDTMLEALARAGAPVIDVTIPARVRNELDPSADPETQYRHHLFAWSAAAGRWIPYHQDITVLNRPPNPLEAASP